MALDGIRVATGGALALLLALATTRCGAASGPAGAATVAAVPSALVGTLQRLATPAPVRGTLTVTRQEQRGGNAGHGEARVVLAVAAAQGIDLHLQGTALLQVEQELQAQKSDAGRPTPMLDLLQATGFLQAAQMLDAGTRLGLLLHGARRLQQDQVMLDGRAATRMRFVLPAPVGADRDHVKQFHDTLTLWLGPDRLPLQYRRATDVEIGWLFFHMTTQRREQGTLHVIDGRLVATRVAVQETTDALGKHGVVDTTYVLDLRAPATPVQDPGARPAPRNAAAPHPGDPA